MEELFHRLVLNNALNPLTSKDDEEIVFSALERDLKKLYRRTVNVRILDIVVEGRPLLGWEKGSDLTDEAAIPVTTVIVKYNFR